LLLLRDPCNLVPAFIPGVNASNPSVGTLDILVGGSQSSEGSRLRSAMNLFWQLIIWRVTLDLSLLSNGQSGHGCDGISGSGHDFIPWCVSMCDDTICDSLASKQHQWHSYRADDPDPRARGRLQWWAIIKDDSLWKLHRSQMRQGNR
jgi:hypothetical protein